MSWLYVPHEKDWNKEKEPLWHIGFENILVDESEIEDGLVYFEYQVNDVHASQWDNFSVCVNINKRTVKGDGSRKFREYILNNILYWYLKAKNEDEFNELLY